MDDTIITTYYLCEEFLKASRPPRRPASPPLHRRGDVHSSCRSRLLRRQHREDSIVPGRVRLHRKSDLQESLQPKASCHRSLPLADALRSFGRNLQAIPPRSNLRGRLPAGRRVRQHPHQAAASSILHEEHGEAFRGYIASKRRYFYGLRVHLVVSGKGEPVEFSLAAASEADVKVFKELDLDLPEGATIHADKGYTDYHYEDLLEDVGVNLISKARRDPSGHTRHGRSFWRSPSASTSRRSSVS